MEKAILVALRHPSISINIINDSLNELKLLAATLDITILENVIQTSTSISISTYIKKGKVAELKKMIAFLEIDVVIFDDPLSPLQIKNLEIALETKIIDRSFLILAIFAKRAKTKEALLEVSLAQKRYLLPRLIGMSKSLSRQGGSSFNSKGPGEKKLELNKRKLLSEIVLLEKELKELKRIKETNQKRRIRTKIFKVALIGYTNSGKSSTMNSLSEILISDNTKVLAENALFATLDTKVKRLKKANQPPFLLIDTVGFISKLPTELVNSFHSTLSELKEADLILHIIDPTEEFSQKVAVTLKILEELGAHNIERIVVFTKKDLLNDFFDEDALYISNKTKEGIDDLIANIYNFINLSYSLVYLKVAYDDYKTISMINSNHLVLKSSSVNENIIFQVLVNKEELNRLKRFLV